MDKKSKRELSQVNQKVSDLPTKEESIEELVAELKENPRFKDFNKEQLKTVAEICIVEKSEEYWHSSFSGPLPPPDTLEGYESTLPGSANRIIMMAEENAKNRIELNKNIVKADIFRSNRGQFLGFILSVIFIGAAILCAYLKQPFPASILGVGGFSSIISIFVLGRK